MQSSFIEPFKQIYLLSKKKNNEERKANKKSFRRTLCVHIIKMENE